MEHQKILNLLIKASNPNFFTRKWNIVNDQSNANFDVGSKIIYNTEVLHSIIFHYNDDYILVRGDITIIGRSFPAEVTFQNCALFIKFVTKVDGTATGHSVVDLHLIIPIYNLLEHSSNCSDTTSSL